MNRFTRPPFSKEGGASSRRAPDSSRNSGGGAGETLAFSRRGPKGKQITPSLAEPPCELAVLRWRGEDPAKVELDSLERGDPGTGRGVERP